MSKYLITTSMYEEVDTHIVGPIGDYTTLCGQDGDDPDPGVQQFTLDDTGTAVTCWACKKIWEHCRKVKPSLIANTPPHRSRYEHSKNCRHHSPSDLAKT